MDDNIYRGPEESNASAFGNSPREIRKRAMKAMSPTQEELLLGRLPLEVWTEGPDGQALLELSRRGLCKYTRLNATLGRFEPRS